MGKGLIVYEYLGQDIVYPNPKELLFLRQPRYLLLYQEEDTKNLDRFKQGITFFINYKYS